MAEELKEQTATVTEKPTEDKTTAPIEDKPVEKPSGNESLDSKETIDTIDETLMILNIIDQEKGGKGEIAEVPEGMKVALGGLIDNLVLIRDLFEDPDWKAILDDMADQKEDGKTPSVMVAIARNFPIEEIQKLAENEDYEGVQNELSSKLAAQKETEKMESDYESAFDESKKAGEEYAAEMGYNDEERNTLFQFVLDLFAVMADGKLTKEEFRKVDKMRNYDKDTEDLRSQIQPEAKKEVLPDKASVDAALQAKPKAQATQQKSVPGLGSMGAYSNAQTDITKIGSRKRK